MAEEFYSFEKALRELQMREEELKRLVSAGEIRAFREGDQMKLKREDVERLRQREEEGEVVDLGGDLASEEAPGMATAQISEADTLLADDDEALEEAISLPEETAAASLSASGRARPRAAAGRAVEETAGEGMGMRVAIVTTTILLVLGAFVAHGAANVDSSGIAGGIANLVKGMMGP